jgi:outer membrane beta-barrel protein
MNKEWKLSGLAAVGVLALVAAPAQAQVEGAGNELGVYGGELFGDDLTDTAVSGRTPKLDDDFTYGVRYAYNLNKAFAVELGIGETPSSATELAGSDVDLDLTTFDVDAVWHFDLGSRVVPYVLAGVGYARANLDEPITGTVNGQAVSIDDDEGFTANAGVGAKFFVNDAFLVRLEGRYRYLDGVLDRFDDSLNTFETTLGVSWRF